MANRRPRRSRVLIVARTRMRSGLCIGGMVDQKGEPVRLIPIGRSSHLANSPFLVGEIWEMNLRARPRVEPPHVEDCEEWNARRVGRVTDLATYIRNRIEPVRGAPDALFDGVIRFRIGGTGYIDITRPLPANSVQFWELPRVLRFDPFDGKPRYCLAGRPRFRAPYVGVQPSIEAISRGTLVRLSLARPWRSAPSAAEHVRCSVQLSGWY